MKDRLLLPLGIPIGALVTIGVLVFLLSRVLLAVPREIATPIALIVALTILFGCAYLATRSVVDRGMILGAVAVGLLLLTAVVPYLVLAGQGIAESIAERRKEEASQVGLPPGTVVISASNNLNVFDKKSITIPASGNVTIRFRNNDVGVVHNWALYDKKGGTEIFKGDNITGPATIDYVFPSPGPGTYYYQCDIHPATMFGEATAK